MLVALHGHRRQHVGHTRGGLRRDDRVQVRECLVLAMLHCLVASMSARSVQRQRMLTMRTFVLALALLAGLGAAGAAVYVTTAPALADNPPGCSGC